jgi:hypothetical protein
MTQQQLRFDVFRDLFPIIWADSLDPTAQALIQVLKTADSELEIRNWISENLQKFQPDNREGLIEMLSGAPISAASKPRELTARDQEDADCADPLTDALLTFALIRLEQVKEVFAPIIRDAHFARKKRKGFLKESKTLIQELEDAMIKDQPQIFNHPKYKQAFDEFTRYIEDARTDLSKLPQ